MAIVSQTVSPNTSYDIGVDGDIVWADTSGFYPLELTASFSTTAGLVSTTLELGFNFASLLTGVSAGTSIIGIKIGVWKRNEENLITDQSVTINGGTNQAIGGGWGEGSLYEYGSETNDWGAGLTVGDLQSNPLSVAFKVEKTPTGTANGYIYDNDASTRMYATIWYDDGELIENVCEPVVDHQYTFLGCSIESFNVTMGLNEQEGELTVNLVEDCASVPEGGNTKIAYNSNLDVVEFTGPDPGFVRPNVGSPVYFRVKNFEFTGILQGFTETNNEGGSPRYTVRVVDPRQILAGTTLIIGDYSGGVGATYNLINVFGWAEQFGSQIPSPFEPTCSDTFGSALGFGGSNANAAGMQWNRILAGVRVLTSAIPAHTNIHSPYGRLVFKGPKFGGNGVLPPDAQDINLYSFFSNLSISIQQAFHDGFICGYFVDLDEMPLAPDYFRLEGSNISLLDAITQVCEAAGYDYYIELVPIRLGGQILKIIKVRTINRNNQPLLNVLANYITSTNVVDSSLGQELRNETTSVFISGGLKEGIYTTVQNSAPSPDPEQCLTDLFLPGNGETYVVSHFVGFDTNGSLLVQNYNSSTDEWQFRFTSNHTDLVYNQLKGTEGVDIAYPSGGIIIVNEMEILAAKAGFDAWQLYAYALNTQLKQMVDSAGTANGIMTITHATRIINGGGEENAANLRPMDFMKFSAGAAGNNEKNLQHNLEIAFKWISTIANDYYGKKFCVRVPNVCVKYDSESGQVTHSEIPVDSAWTDSTTILGLTNPSTTIDIFTTEEGKIKPIAYYSDATLYETKDYDSHEYLISGGALYLEAEVEPGYVYAHFPSLCSPRVILNVVNAPTFKEPNSAWFNKNQGALVNALGSLINDGEIKGEMLQNVQSLFLFGSQQRAVLPDAFAIPFQSNINRYGPWITAGPPGQIRFEINDDLVPWNYAGQAALCLAGQALADEGVTFQQAVEAGSVTVPGYPIWRAGDEFNRPTHQNDLVDNRGIALNDFAEVPAGQTEPVQVNYASVILNDYGNWNGSFGPNITDISVSVGTQGVLTTFGFRTYVNKTGRFSKGNADRLKRIGRALYQGRKFANNLGLLLRDRKKGKKRGGRSNG